MTTRFRAAGTCVFVLACCASCRQESARTGRSTTSLSMSIARDSVVQSPERPLAGRREAQPFLDSAGVLLASGDTNSAVALLNRASALVQARAGQPRGAAGDALLAVSDSIDRYAGALARREPSGASPLARLSVLLNLAEADRHLALASVACSTRSRESVYDELTMAIDHVERASRDGSFPRRASRRAAVAEARRAAAPLATDCAQDLASLDDAIASLRREVDEMRRTLVTQ